MSQPPQARLGEAARFAWRTFTSWRNRGGPLMGAGIAFYGVFSTLPLLLVLVFALGQVLGEDLAHSAVFNHLKTWVGAEAASLLRLWVEEAAVRERRGASLALGLVFTLVGATTLLAHVQASLDRLWVREHAPHRHPHMIRRRFVALAIVFGVGVLVLVALAAGGLVAGVSATLGPALGLPRGLIRLVDAAGSLTLLVALLALIFATVPRARIAPRHIVWGALLTGTAIAAARLLMYWALSRTGFESWVGAAGSATVLLLWVYASAQIFLIGAQATWLLAEPDAPQP